MKKLTRSFFLNPDVVSLARALIGKRLLSCIDGRKTGGIITETEAYAGVTDKASHAYGGRRTGRTETMYGIGGTAYVYLCYGVHSLFNIVTNRKDIPHAVLIRSIRPDTGIDCIMQRRGIHENIPRLTTGPGSLAQALAIRTVHSGTDLTGSLIWLENSDIPSGSLRIIPARRIGIDYAGKDALKKWRFLLADSPWVSHPPAKH